MRRSRISSSARDRVDRVARLLEVAPARGATSAASAPAGGASLRAARFSSVTVDWAIMSVTVMRLSSAS